MAPLEASDAAWLDGHLGGCDECRAIAAAYADDRELLRAMPVPEPPRDLWARTSVALERERTGRPAPMASAPRLRIRWQALAGTLAVLLDRASSPAGRSSRRRARASPCPRARRRWRRDRRRDAARHSPGRRRLGGTGCRRFVHRESRQPRLRLPGQRGHPTGLRLARCRRQGHRLAQVAPRPGGPRPGGRSGRRRGRQRRDDRAARSWSCRSIGRRRRRRPRPARPRRDPPTAKPTADGRRPAPPTERTTESGRRRRVRRRVRPPDRPPRPSRRRARPRAPSTSREPTTSPSGSPDLDRHARPTATAAALAIIDDVIVVGGDAAYSSDGRWLAFSARPADGSAGPDVFVWHVGDERAEPLTDDHGTVFSAWVDGKILASRAAPAGDGSTARRVGGPGSPTADLDPARPGDRQAARRRTSLGLWRPVVDPAGRWVVYWTGQPVTRRRDPHAPGLRRRPPGHRPVGRRSRRRPGRDLATRDCSSTSRTRTRSATGRSAGIRPVGTSGCGSPTR